MDQNRRMHVRTDCSVPVSFGNFYLEKEAVVLNRSEGGVYLETDQELSEGAFFYLRMTVPAPDEKDENTYGAFAAQVRWCRQKTTEVFGIGGKFISKAIIIEKNDDRSPDFSCDLCVGPAPEEVFRTDDHLLLCPKCFSLLEGSGNKRLKKNIKRFILGNVI